jgi:hypothetical protein
MPSIDCRAIVLVAIACLASCTVSRPRLGDVPGSERDSIRVNPSRPTAGAREMLEKRVRDKRANAMLVATDDSWCVVDDEEFARIRIGDTVRCAWVASAPR